MIKSHPVKKDNFLLGCIYLENDDREKWNDNPIVFSWRQNIHLKKKTHLYLYNVIRSFFFLKPLSR